MQTKRPKRLLIDDLTMHLRPYACGVNCTIVIMGDLNTDLISRAGYDNRALQIMIDDLGLVSCADARWPASSCVFKTHKGDEAHAASHIGYILISERNASAVRKFGIDADRDRMVDFDHAVMFTDVDMCQVLWLERPSSRPPVPVRRKSTIRYSDKPGVAQFREFAEAERRRSDSASAPPPPSNRFSHCTLRFALVRTSCEVKRAFAHAPRAREARRRRLLLCCLRLFERTDGGLTADYARASRLAPTDPDRGGTPRACVVLLCGFSCPFFFEIKKTPFGVPDLRLISP